MVWTRPNIWGFTLLCACVALLACSTTNAATLHSAPDSTRTTAPCAQTDPCRLDAALNLAVATDDVSLIPGDYYLTGTQGFPDTLAVDPGVILHGSPDAPLPVIHGLLNGPSEALVSVQGGEARDLELQVDSLPSPAATFVAGLILFNGGSAERLAVRVTPQPGVSASGCSVTLAGGNLSNSLCYSRSDVTAAGGGASDGTATFRNVTFYGHGIGGANGIGMGASTNVGTTNLTASNVIAHGPGPDIFVSATAPPGSASLTIDHSNWEDSSFGLVGTGATSVSGTANQNNTTYQAPIFVDAAAGDLRAAAGSPTIDAGITSVLNGPLALDGNARSIGGSTDIGAYEFGPPPVVTTGPANLITERSARMTATVNPSGHATTTEFEYGTSTAYGSSVNAADVGPDAGTSPVEATINGLQPDTLYHYRAVATSAGGGEGAGEDRTFTTAEAPPPPPPPPSPVTLGKLKIKKKWSLRKGVVLGFRVSRAAQVKFTFDRRKQGKLRRQGVRIVEAKAGPNRIQLSKKLKLRRGKRLVPGRYRLTGVATAPDGARSVTRRVAFRIKR